jgi:hypothetical protein
MMRLILIAAVMASAVTLVLGAPVPDLKPQVKTKTQPTAESDYKACVKAVEKGKVVTLNHGVYHQCDFYTNTNDQHWKNIEYGVYICYLNVEDGKPTMKRVELDHRIEPVAQTVVKPKPIHQFLQPLFPQIMRPSCGPGGCPQPQFVPGFR